MRVLSQVQKLLLSQFGVDALWRTQPLQQERIHEAKKIYTDSQEE